MTEEFGPVRRPQSRGTGYSTVGITNALISYACTLGALFFGLLIDSFEVMLLFIVAGVIAIAAVIWSALSISKKEEKGRIALVMSLIAVLFVSVAYLYS